MNFRNAVALIAVIISSRVVKADVIFSDTFDTFPNGWTTSVTGTGGGTINSNGFGQFFFLEGGGTGSATFDLTRTVSTVGFESITVNLTAFQVSTSTYENSDQLGIFVNTGSGFSEVFRDEEVWNGVDDRAGEGSTGADGNATPTSTGEIALGGDADSNAMLQVRIRGISNVADEVYLLDAFSVSGNSIATVPEPSTFGLIAFLGIAGIARKRAWPR